MMGKCVYLWMLVVRLHNTTSGLDQLRKSPERDLSFLGGRSIAQELQKDRQQLINIPTQNSSSHLNIVNQ